MTGAHRRRRDPRARDGPADRLRAHSRRSVGDRRSRARDREPRRLDLGGRRAPARCARCRRPICCSTRRRSRRSGRPTHLERLARTYWRFLTRVTLGLIRVRYTETRALGRAARAPAEAAHLPRARIRDGPRARPGALAHRAGPAGLQAGARRRRLPADRGAPPSRRGPRRRPICTSRSRSPTSTRRSPPASAAGSTTRPSRAST